MSKGRASFKGFIFLLIILLVVGGIVAAIFLWPQKPEEVKGSINNQVSVVLKEDGDLLKSLKDYGEYAIDYRTDNVEADNSYQSVLKVYTALSTYFDFLSYTFENADFAQYEIGVIKNAQYGMNDATTAVNKVSEFLKKNNEALTADGFNTKVYQPTDASLVWKNILTDIKTSFVQYEKATENLAKVYEKNITKGVYANDFAKVTMNGVSYYLNYFETKFEKLGTEEYTQMAKDFENFVSAYLGKSEEAQRMVARYHTSSEIQKNVKVLINYGEFFKDYTLQNLCLDALSYDAGKFTVSQTGYLVVGVKFFKGELTKWKR